ncbi:hypothetical protein H4582DRAFT_2065217 [Lactarius indigo]|nr:hypothetical protein H4582DRAFT_2065217 [Lactarius indigo]
MPTATTSAGLLAAGAELWSYSQWQEQTNYAIPPFSPNATKALTGLDDGKISSVKALTTRVHVLPDWGARVSELGKKQSNDSDGQKAWKEWVHNNIKEWKVWTEIEDILDACGRHPRQLIGQPGCGGKVPTMDDANVSEVYGAIAERLFGNDAYRDPSAEWPLIKPELKTLLSTLVAHLWHKMRNQTSRAYERLQTGRRDVHDEFDALNNIDDQRKLKISDFQKWFRKVDRLKLLASSFNDAPSLRDLDDQVTKMDAVYKALTGELSPSVTKGLSKNLRDALKYLATQGDVAMLCAQLAERLELHGTEDTEI